MQYGGIDEGQIERIDPPNPQARNVERCFDVIWQIDFSGRKHQRNVFVEKWNELPVLVVRGLGDDVVWWSRLPALNNYAFFDLKTDTAETRRPNGYIMLVAVLVQQVDAGKQEEWRTIVTNFVVRR
jgi:hypothetical protein